MKYNKDCEQCLEITNWCNECWAELSKEERKEIKNKKKDSKEKNVTKIKVGCFEFF